jgi:carboxylate-amine ligase
VTANAADGVGAVAALRARARAAGATTIGAGIHPDGAFGDVIHVDEPRYHEIHDQLRGLLRRTPTCALHVHVGMPDAETAIRVYNGLREHLPLLQALAANSPFWHGTDSGLATARAQLFRGYPRGDIPPSFASFEHFEETVAGVVAAGDAPDYTFLWWDIRPHPRLGTVEVRAMDAQSALWSVSALAGLVHGLARAVAQEEGAPPGGWTSREVLMESSFRAARDGLGATLWHDGALRPVPELARAAVARARPHARELGSGDALDQVERMLTEGGGADRQRAAFARGGMRGVLEHLARETAAEL